jgi:outer membrane protein assembly factor BamB
VTDTHKTWEIRKGSEVGSPLYYKGHLYWAHQEDGIAFCVDAKTGATVYEKRIQPRPGRIYASGIIADDRIYYVSQEKGTFVVPAEPRFELLAHNTLESDSSLVNATPAISRGQVLLRSDDFLYCLGDR